LVSKAEQAQTPGIATPVSTPGAYSNLRNVLMNTPSGGDSQLSSSNPYRDQVWGFSPDVNTPLQGTPLQISQLASSYEGTLGEDESLADMY
jgi:hypothetical protein